MVLIRPSRERSTQPATTRKRATALGSVAVVLWSGLALLTTLARDVPPLQLTAMAFSVAFVGSVVAGKGQNLRPATLKDLPPKAWAVGIGGLFGYHLLYFIALRNAPVVEANLVNYLWPLLTVLLSSFLPGERLRWHHAAGGLCGFAGAALLITGGSNITVEPTHVPGYLAALAAAFTWAGYSVLSRRFGYVPTSAVGAFCGATALLAWLAHGAWESTVTPSRTAWLVVLIMGLGPLGAAFFAWDKGVKRGDIKTLGALSYLAPLLSTCLLVLAGRTAPGWSLAAACVLIVGGAVLAAGAWRRSRAEPEK